METGTRRSLWMSWNRSARRLRGSCLCLGIAGAFLAIEGRDVAQAQIDRGEPLGATPEWRLTVRPREMATGTQNPPAGKHPLESFSEHYEVYVPPQCAGARRCPLLLVLPTGGIMESLRPATDKYGLIALVVPRAMIDREAWRAASIDPALKKVLETFAIDPDKIAVLGRCASGLAATRLGANNLHVFNRIASISGGVELSALAADSANKAVEFFFSRAVSYEERADIAQARKLRQQGYTVKNLVALRGHEHHMEDYDALARWLQESWTKPDPATRAAPSIVADPLPVLTTTMLTQMTAFWTKFQQEPDSIRMTARRAHLREVAVPVGPEQVAVPIVDMPALAAKYPSVAAAFQAAGLTPQQHEAYRIALINAMTTKGLESKHPTIAETLSAPEKQNLAFLKTDSDELRALEATNTWRTP